VGDFLDSPTVACRVKSEIIQLLHHFGIFEDRRMLCVYGQHDITGHSKWTLPNSPLAVLQAAKVVKILDADPFYIDSTRCFYGASFGEPVPEPCEDFYNILVTHRMVGDRPLWPGQELTGPRAFLRKHPGYNLVVSFTGDTKVSLLSGDEVDIKDLVGKKEFYIYSYDHYTNSIVPGRAHSCRKTKQNVPILKITLDNGEVIRCDYDERFLLRNRRYRLARELEVGDSLMPLYRRFTDRGYEELRQPMGKWEKTHRIVYNWKYGFIKKKPVTHHKDYDKLNNPPGNMLAMSWNGHFWFHSRRHKEMWENPKFRGRMVKAIREGIKKKCDDPIRKASWIAKLSSKAIERCKDPIFRRKLRRIQKEVNKRLEVRKKKSDANKRRVEEGTHIFIVNNPNIERMKDGSLQEQIDRMAHDPRINKIRANTMRRLAKEGNHPAQIRIREGTHNFIINHPMKSEEGKQKSIRTRIKSQIEFLQDSGLEVNKENWNSNRVYRNTPSFNTALKYVDLIQQFNHKVVSVEFDGYEDVYSFKVDKHHNFALSAGVFAHNCGDYHYRFTDTWNGRTIINPGAIVRKTIGKFDLEHKPAVVIFDTDTSESEVIELKVEPPEKVFNLTKEVKRADNQVLADLVEKLKSGGKKLSGWKHFLVKIFDERNTMNRVRDVIDQSLGEVKNGKL